MKWFYLIVAILAKVMWWSGNQVLPSEGKPEFPKKEIRVYEGLYTIQHLAPSDMKAICMTFTNE